MIAAPAIVDLRNRWFISDTHFFHEKLLTFEKEDGHKCRSEFSSIEEHNETIIERWNARVRSPRDKVRHLGDVALGITGREYETKLDPLLSRLNGRMDLILGNHDKPKNKIIQKHFKRIELWKTYGHKDQEFPFTLTHIPQRLDQLRKSYINIHGHIHEKLMDEPHYINVCCEHTNYAPVHLDEILAVIKKRGL